MWVYIVIGLGVVLLFLIFFCLAVANFSFDNFKENREKAMNYANSQNMTVNDLVEYVQANHLKGRLKVETCEEYRDHFSPGVIALSPSTRASNSLASLATVSHEFGHAVQFEKGELTKHWQKRKKNQLINKFFIPCMLIGLVLSILGVITILPDYVVYIGIAFFGVSFFIFLTTLYMKYLEVKVEKAASIYALKILSELLTPQEVRICKDLLDSARLTYWGNLFKAMLWWTFLTKKS